MACNSASTGRTVRSNTLIYTNNMKLDKMIDIKDINLLKFKAIDFSEPSTGAKALERDFLYYLCNHLGHFTDCSKYSLYEAMALVLRDRIMSNWHRTWDTYHQSNRV